jgi:hypothetical protein
MPQEVLESGYPFRGLPVRIPSVPKHVNVDRKRQLGGPAGTLDHATDAHAAERMASFVDKNVRACPLRSDGASSDRWASASCAGLSTIATL